MLSAFNESILLVVDLRWITDRRRLARIDRLAVSTEVDIRRNAESTIMTERHHLSQDRASERYFRIVSEVAKYATSFPISTFDTC